MISNEILDEVRRSRDAVMAECGGELARLAEHCRNGEARWVGEGHPLVSFIGHPRIELPLPDWEKIDTAPENEIIAEIRSTRRRLAEEAASCVVREAPPQK